MRITQLQRAAFIGVLALAGVGAAGMVGMQALAKYQEAEQGNAAEIPTRSNCINDGLRNVQGQFSRQIAYDIEVRCEQMIQSLEGRGSKTAQR